MVKKIIAGIFYAFSALLMAWVLLSYFDITIDNNSGAPVHSKYNLFVVCFDSGREAQN